MVKLGILTEQEIRQVEQRYEVYPYLSELSLIPLAWAQQTIRTAFEEGQINPKDTSGVTDHTTLQFAIEAIRAYRTQCASVLFQVYLPFPLLLSQLVTILTYVYVLITIVSQQDTDLPGQPEFHFPFFTCLEALVYIGALRVGQVYTNPLGADDDDYEIVSFFNRNVRLAHVYGNYGNTSDTFHFDLHAHAPPIEDLSVMQSRLMQNIPINFYDHTHSKTGVFGRSNGKVPLEIQNQTYGSALDIRGKTSRPSARYSRSSDTRIASDLGNDMSQPLYRDGSVSS
jgi:hypothetical protein